MWAECADGGEAEWLGGIEYHPPGESLVVSVNYAFGVSNNFVRIATNGVVTQWSGVKELTEEIKLATVKATANGFTVGDMFFGHDSPGVIGWLSADSTVSNLSWCVLTNAAFTNEAELRGSLYVDQSGSFGGDLIVVTGDSSPSAAITKSAWRVNATGQPTLLTTLETLHLEGVMTLTNDVQRWGPWAGEGITGDENAVAPNGFFRPSVYAVHTNGAIASFALEIAPEDFDIITPNQDLYCVAFRGSGSPILKLSRTLLTNYVGDLMITQAGEYGLASKLFITHWDGTNSSFVTRSISLPDGYGAHFEHVTFAPISLPPITP